MVICSRMTLQQNTADLIIDYYRYAENILMILIS
jgi:hypothetical protein